MVTVLSGVHHLIVPLHLNILYKLLLRRNLILDSADRFKAELKRGNDICLSYRCSVSVRISDMANAAGKGSFSSSLKRCNHGVEEAFVAFLRDGFDTSEHRVFPEVP